VGKEFFNLRGVAYFKGGEYEKAAKNFRASLDIDSGSPYDLVNLGVCHSFLGNSEEALDHLGAALKMDLSLEYARTQYDELKES